MKMKIFNSLIVGLGGWIICFGFLFTACQSQASVTPEKRKVPVSFLPAPGFGNGVVALGTITQYEERIQNTWRIKLANVEVLLQVEEKDINEIEITLSTGLGGVWHLAPNKNWIGERAFFLVHERNGKYYSPSSDRTRLPLSPDQELFYLIPPKSEKMIEEIRQTSRLLTLETDERRNQLLQLVEVAEKPVFLRAFAMEEFVWLSKRTFPTLLPTAIRQLFQWRNDEKLMVDLRLTADKLLMNNLSAEYYFWSEQRIAFLKAIQNRKDASEDTRRYIYMQLERAEQMKARRMKQ